MARPARTRKEDPETKPKRAKGRNMGSLVAAFMMLAIISALVLYGIMLGKRNMGTKADQQEPAKEEVVDPFAGMKYTEEGLGTKAYSGTGGTKDFESEAEMWQVARAAYDQAQALMVESAQLRANSDVTWRDKTAEAKELMEEAVQRGEVWRSVLSKETGAKSDLVKRLDKTLQRWRTTLLKLRKTSSR